MKFALDLDNEKKDVNLTVGARVTVGGLGLEGVVVSLDGKNADVDVRGKRMRAKARDLRVIGGPPATARFRPACNGGSPARKPYRRQTGRRPHLAVRAPSILTGRAMTLVSDSVAVARMTKMPPMA